jgi:membrane associated rhomboid family serine protease
VLLAFGMLFPDRIVLFSFLFPMKAKYFVMIIGAIAFLSSIGGSGGGVSHFAHLGGMVFAYGYLKGLGRNWNFGPALGRRYQQWRVERAKKKFQVYLRKHNRRDIH